jgi:hypothetical protein
MENVVKNSEDEKTHIENQENDKHIVSQDIYIYIYMH